MLSFVNAALLSGWLVLALTALLRWGRDGGREGGGGYWAAEEKRIRRQADRAGVIWGSKETRTIWLVSLSAACALYFCTGNLLLFGAGWLLMLILPSMVIDSRMRRARLGMLTALTDCLRGILARLPDQGSLSRAMELVIAGGNRSEATDILSQVLEELRLGSDIKDAIGLWKSKVGLKKFDHVAETMIQANQDGWTPAALKALDKAVQGLEEDLKAVLLTAQKAAGRKRQLFGALATAWSFPLILSLMDTGQHNVFLYSLPGKILIFAYVVVSLFVIVKGQEYLSLNVEEL